MARYLMGDDHLHQPMLLLSEGVTSSTSATPASQAMFAMLAVPTGQQHVDTAPTPNRPWSHHLPAPTPSLPHCVTTRTQAAAQTNPAQHPLPTRGLPHPTLVRPYLQQHPQAVPLRRDVHPRV